MQSEVPVHFMIKPEGMNFLHDFLKDRIYLVHALIGTTGVREIRTRLTPEEVDMIYPGAQAPDALKQKLAEEITEHYFFLVDRDAYTTVVEAKGKYGISGSMRDISIKAAKRTGEKLERWQNFIHAADSGGEARRICSRLIHNSPICINCALGKDCETDTN